MLGTHIHDIRCICYIYHIFDKPANFQRGRALPLRELLHTMIYTAYNNIFCIVVKIGGGVLHSITYGYIQITYGNILVTYKGSSYGRYFRVRVTYSLHTETYLYIWYIETHIVHITHNYIWYIIHIVHTKRCDCPEAAHRKWMRKQGTKTNQGPEVQLSIN